MSLAHPAVLHRLLDQYERLQAHEARTPDEQHRLRRVGDALRVAGGSRDLGSAVTAVRRHIRYPSRASSGEGGAAAASPGRRPAEGVPPRPYGRS
jgi:hypothetical protein